MTVGRALQNIFNRARIDDRLVNELIGVCRGATADGVLTQSEAEFLQRWLIANQPATSNPVVATLLLRINEMLADGVLDREESQELLETLNAFVGGDYELGELTRSTTLPIDVPAPDICIPESYFCFTGTFAYGSRSECERAIEDRGGYLCSVSKKIDYLVIGCYATDSWIHSSYGRKIEKALDLKAQGHKVAIIREDHWVSMLI